MKKEQAVKIGIALFLALFIGLHFYMGMANVFDKKLSHDSPYGYTASDSFWHLLYSKSLINKGTYNQFQPFMVAGHNDVITTNPPALPHLVAVLSIMSGLSTYDSEMLFVFLIPVLSSLIIFILLKHFDIKLALLSMPFTLLLYTGKFMTVYTWGIWTVALSNLFLIGLVYLVSNENLRNPFLLISIFIAAILESYTVTIVFAAGFLGILCLINILKLSEFKKRVWDYSKSFVLGILISGYYIFLLYFAIYKVRGGSYTQSVSQGTNFGYSTVLLTDFGWILLLILAIGLIFYFLFIKNKLRLDFVTGAFFFLAGFLYLITFGKASLTIRFFWPLYLAIFFGIAVLCIIKFMKLDNKFISIILGAGITIFFALVYFAPIASTGIMPQQEWDSYTWINSNVKENETLLFFYSDSYTQTSKLLYGDRIPYMIPLNSIKPFIENETYPSSIKTSIIYEGIGGLPYKKSFFTLGSHIDDNGADYYNPVKVICDFDYIVFDMANYNQQISQYSQGYLNHMIDEEKGSLVYNNNMICILKINKEKC